MRGTWPRPSSAISRSSRPSICPGIDPSSTPSFTSSRPSPPTRSTRSSPSATCSPAISSKQQPEKPLIRVQKQLQPAIGRRSIGELRPVMSFGGSQTLRIGEPVLEYGGDGVPDDGGTRPPQTEALNEAVALPLASEDEAVPPVPRVLVRQTLNGQLIVSVTRPEIDGNAWTEDVTQDRRVGCQRDRGIEGGLARPD